MADISALVSCVAMVTDQDLRLDHLKLCYLWYDEIIFEALRPDLEESTIRKLLGDISQRDLHEITDVIIPLSRRVSNEVSGTATNRLPMGYPRWGTDRENYDYPEPEDALEFAHNQMLRAIETQHGVTKFGGYDVEQAEGRARVAVDAVALWERVNREYPCMLQSTPDEKIAVSAAASFQKARSLDDASIQLYDALIPSLANVSWSDIAELRRKGGFQLLRTKIDEASAIGGADIEKAKKIFLDFEDDTVNEIVEKFKPNTRRVALEAVLANIPGFPIFNPFSLFFGSRDTGMAIKNTRELNWFYLLRDIRTVANNSPKTL